MSKVNKLHCIKLKDGTLLDATGIKSSLISHGSGQQPIDKFFENELAFKFWGTAPTTFYELDLTDGKSMSFTGGSVSYIKIIKAKNE